MSTRGQFNSKNPTIKRILKEASELANNASSDYYATPLEDNLFEWHFTLRGPPEPSPFAGGLYHGRIVLPNAYPHRPPSFRFLTPSGRFEVNREICLSISGFHEETWQPAWGIRTALVAIRSFMDTGAKGQIGGLECDPETRKKFAGQSRAWKCPTCALSNEEIIQERERAVQEMEKGPAEEEQVPDELRLAYREDLSEKPATSTSQSTASEKGKEKAVESTVEIPKLQSQAPPQPQPQTQAQSNTITQRNVAAAANQPTPTRTTRPASTTRQAVQPQRQSTETPWLDSAIYAVIAALAILILRKVF